jgi:anti-sigma factor RsiW
MNCVEARRLLSLELDGELSEETAFVLARHLDECARCRQRFAAERGLEQGLRRTLIPGAGATPELWARIEKQLARRRPARSWLMFGAAAAVLAALFLLKPFAEPPASLAGVLAVMHEKVLAGTEVPQAELSGAEAVASFFRERLPFPVQVPDGVDVRGGRVCAVKGQKLALVFARDSGRAVSLFTLPKALLGAFPAEAAAMTTQDSRASRHSAANVVLHATDGLLLAAAADLPVEQLRALLQAPR